MVRARYNNNNPSFKCQLADDLVCAGSFFVSFLFLWRCRFFRCNCVCIVCVVIPFILDVWLVDVPARVTEEEGHTGFLHLPCAVLDLIFPAIRIQPFLSLVDHEVEFCVLTS